MEYQGEIYNDQIYEKRMQEYKERDEINYYVMKFGRELYVDAAAEVKLISLFITIVTPSFLSVAHV